MECPVDVHEVARKALKMPADEAKEFLANVVEDYVHIISPLDLLSCIVKHYPQILDRLAK